MLDTYVTHDGSNSVRYNMLYSVYSYPNTFMPLIAGVMIDRVGINTSIVVFGVLIVIGQGIFTLAGFLGTTDQGNLTPFFIALVGRFLFGMGSEPTDVCQSTIGSRWFKGKELSFAIGIMITFSKLGSVINNYTIPPFAQATSLGWALFLGMVLCVLSFGFGLVFIMLERFANNVDQKRKVSNTLQVDKIQCKDVKTFNLSFWLISINCMLMYMGIFCFNNISNEFFRFRYGFSQDEAARLTSGTFLTAAFLTPVFGIFCDKYGKRASLCCASGGILVICHTLFLVIPSSTSESKSYLGLIPIILLGLVYSIFAAVIWSMIPLVVKPKVVGTAYGL